MTKLNDIYGGNSQWLKAEDLQGAKPIVTIESAEVKENTYNGETKSQIVLTFRGKDKCLGLNFTNASRIAELTGTENFDDWVGVSLKLFVEKVKFQDKMVDAIRIFPELPAGSAPVEPPMQFSGPVSEPDDTDSIPF